MIDKNQLDQYLRGGEMKQVLSIPLKDNNSRDNRLADLLGGSKDRQETLLYCGLTLGDLLYDYIRISPVAVAGIDFARADDLQSIFSFAEFARRHSGLEAESFSGSLHQMHGYVAEQVVALNLKAQGHDVTFPETSNQKGWDLLVDGEKFQVKCLADPAGVHEHISRYPDIPVIVNSELADKVGHHPNVYVDQLLDHSSVVQMTESSLDYGSEMLDFEIPVISLAVSSAAALRDLMAGETTLKGATAQVITNTGGRIALGGLGSLAAGAAGLMLFGPAGNLVFSGAGAVGGAYFGKEAARKLRKLFMTQEDKAVQSAAAACARDATQVAERKLLAWRDKRETVGKAEWSSTPNARFLHNYVDERMQHDLAYYENKRRELETISKGSDEEPLKLWERLLTLIKRAGIHPHGIQGGLKHLKSLLEEYRAASKKYAV